MMLLVSYMICNSSVLCLKPCKRTWIKWMLTPHHLIRETLSSWLLTIAYDTMSSWHTYYMMYLVLQIKPLIKGETQRCQYLFGSTHVLCCLSKYSQNVLSSIIHHHVLFTTSFDKSNCALKPCHPTFLTHVKVFHESIFCWFINFPFLQSQVVCKCT